MSTFLKILLFVPMTVASVLISSYAIKYGWNSFVAPWCGLSNITTKASVGVHLLSSIFLARFALNEVLSEFKKEDVTKEHATTLTSVFYTFIMIPILIAEMWIFNAFME